MTYFKRLGVVAAVLLAVTVLFGAQAERASAATRYYVDADALGVESGLSWTDAFVTLQDALAVATSGDQIWVAEGVYYPDEGAGQTDNNVSSTFSMIDGVKIYGGFAGGENALAQRDIDNNVTVLSGDLDQNDPVNNDFILPDPATSTGDNAYHVVSIDATVTNSATLDGFSITAGWARGSGVNVLGGGIYSNSPGGAVEGGNSPALVNLTVQGNRAENGGGLYNQYGNLFVVNSSFVNNNATVAGGGIFNANDGLNNAATPIYVNLLFTGNRASIGGGIYNASGEPKLVNSTLTTNSASQRGGGIYNVNFGTPSVIEIDNSIVWANVAGTSAPQIYNVDNAEATVDVNQAIIQGGCPGQVDCTGVSSSNPAFENAAARIFLLQAGSPGIDAGSNALLPNDGADLDQDGNTSETLPLDAIGNRRAFDGDTNGSSNVDLGAFEFVLNRPTGLTAVYNTGENTTSLTWGDTVNEAAYVIERSGDGGSSWQQIGQRGVDKTDFLDTTMTCGIFTYQYRVFAFNANGRSAPSNVATIERECDIFVDVPEDFRGRFPTFFSYFIHDMYFAGITTGCNAGTPGVNLKFCPRTEVNRGQMAVFILRAIGYPGGHNLTGSSPNPFVDVPQGFNGQLPPVFELWIEDFYSFGITEGCNGGTAGVDLRYCPLTNVTRGQMAVFLMRARAYPNNYTPVGADPNPFVDVPEGFNGQLPPAFAPWIEDFYRAGITTGCNAGEPGVDLRFCPNTVLSRAEMAVFILRAFDDIPSP